MSSIILDVEPKSMEPRIKRALEVLLPIVFTTNTIVTLRETALAEVHRAMEDREIQPDAWVKVEPFAGNMYVTVRGRAPGDTSITVNGITNIETIHSN